MRGWGPVYPSVGRPLQRDLPPSRPVSKALLRRGPGPRFQWQPFLSHICFPHVGPGGHYSLGALPDLSWGSVAGLGGEPVPRKGNAGPPAQPPLSPAIVRSLGSMVGGQRSLWCMHVCLWSCGVHWGVGSGCIHMCLEHVQLSGGPGTASSSQKQDNYIIS